MMETGKPSVVNEGSALKAWDRSELMSGPHRSIRDSNIEIKEDEDYDTLLRKIELDARE
jgi:hypothetical protein